MYYDQRRVETGMPGVWQMMWLCSRRFLFSAPAEIYFLFSRELQEWQEGDVKNCTINAPGDCTINEAVWS